MERIIIKNKEDNAFVIEGISNIAGRKMLKFNIFLNAITNVEINKNSEEIVLKFTLTDRNIIAKSIDGIQNYLLKIGAYVQFDDAVTELLQSLKEAQDKSELLLSKLQLMRCSDVESTAEYKAYSKFCDENLDLTLRDYQYKAAYLLGIGNGGFDFSVPGAGKTIITYAAYKYMKSKCVVNHIFVIGPTSSYNAWVDEYITCFGNMPDFENLASESTKNCRIYLRTSKKNHKEITFINTEKVRMLSDEIVEFISKTDTLLIIDEAHKIKNPNAAVTVAVLEITKYAQSRIILTGTPMPNGYEDLFSLAKTFSPYKNIIPYNFIQLKQITKSNASFEQAAIIRDSIAPYYSRISKKYLIEKGELMPPQYNFIYCDMSKDQEELYQKLNQFSGKLDDNVDEDILDALKKAISIRKMQISANPALLQKSLVSSMDELRKEYEDADSKSNVEIRKLIQADKSVMGVFADSVIVRIVSQYARGIVVTSKNKKVVETAVKLVAEGKKVLIWDVFVKNMEIIKGILQTELGSGIEIINGSVTGEERQRAIRNFREGNSMVLVANPATLAESISLHRVCQNAIYVNRNFNAAQFIQSKDRIHRINMPQETTANYYFILNNDSIDMCVESRLKQKEDRMLEILDADDIEIGGEEMEDSAIMSKQDIEDSYTR